MHDIRALRLRIPLPGDAAWLREQVHVAAAAGFNTVIVDSFFRGFTLFPSRTAREFGLPRLHSSFRRTDFLEIACSAARSARVRIIAALDCLNAGPRHDFPLSPLGGYQFRSLRAAGPARAFGLRRECSSADWLLCACNPDVRDLLGSLAAEIADGYPVDGILLSAIQFGPESGSHAGRCYCANCTSAEKKGELDWDNQRLEEISELLSSIKARARTSRRTLRIWGELPVLPGAKDPQLVHREFDRELVEVCIAPMEIGEQVSGGIELAQFSVTTAEEIAPQIEHAREQFPFGFVCRWASSKPLHLEQLHAAAGASTIALDKEPLAAAVQWLEQSAAGENQPVRAKAAECLALLQAGGTGHASLEMVHALLEPAMPQEGVNAPLDAAAEALVRAFALLRLAIMVRP